MKKIIMALSVTAITLCALIPAVACGEKGHTHTLQHTEAKSETCTEDGNLEYWYCTDCEKYFLGEDAKVQIDSVTVPATGHSYGDWIPVTDATCNAEGSRKRVCAFCEDEDVESIPKTEHNYSDWTITVPAACGDGLKEKECSICHDVQSEVLPGTGVHTYNTENVCTGCGIALPYSKELNYTLNNDDTYTVSSCTSAVGDVVIPYYYEGKPVTKIGTRAFWNRGELTGITFPESITSIGDRAFENCYELTSITLHDGITTIGMQAFGGCTALESVTFPDTVTSLGERAFVNCSALKSVVIKGSVETIKTGTFSGCSSLTSVTIPNSVTLIETQALFYCNKLTDIYYDGTAAEWRAIQKKMNWLFRVFGEDEEYTECIIHCTDEDLENMI